MELLALAVPDGSAGGTWRHCPVTLVYFVADTLVLDLGAQAWEGVDTLLLGHTTRLCLLAANTPARVPATRRLVAWEGKETPSREVQRCKAKEGPAAHVH